MVRRKRPHDTENRTRSCVRLWSKNWHARNRSSSSPLNCFKKVTRQNINDTICFHCVTRVECTCRKHVDTRCSAGKPQKCAWASGGARATNDCRKAKEHASAELEDWSRFGGCIWPRHLDGVGGVFCNTNESCDCISRACKWKHPYLPLFARRKGPDRGSGEPKRAMCGGAELNFSARDRQARRVTLEFK